MALLEGKIILTSSPITAKSLPLDDRALPPPVLFAILNMVYVTLTHHSRDLHAHAFNSRVRSCEGYSAKYPVGDRPPLSTTKEILGKLIKVV